MLTTPCVRAMCVVRAYFLGTGRGGGAGGHRGHVQEERHPKHGVGGGGARPGCDQPQPRLQQHDDHLRAIGDRGLPGKNTEQAFFFGALEGGGGGPGDLRLRSMLFAKGFATRQTRTKAFVSLTRNTRARALQYPTPMSSNWFKPKSEEGGGGGGGYSASYLFYFRVCGSQGFEGGAAETLGAPR